MTLVISSEVRGLVFSGTTQDYFKPFTIYAVLHNLIVSVGASSLLACCIFLFQNNASTKPYIHQSNLLVQISPPFTYFENLTSNNNNHIPNTFVTAYIVL